MTRSASGGRTLPAAVPPMSGPVRTRAIHWPDTLARDRIVANRGLERLAFARIPPQQRVHQRFRRGRAMTAAAFTA
jgi:hypothetical protein